MFGAFMIAAVAAAFAATMVPVLLLGALGWALSKSSAGATLMSLVLLAASGAIAYAMSTTIRGTQDAVRDAAKNVVWAMSPALLLSLLFAALLFRAAR